MSAAELLLLALGLSMDAFAASICKGLSVKKLTVGSALIIGAWFGGFQALMPLIGYFLGSQLAGFIEAFSHLVAFMLLAAIGIHMLREAFVKRKQSTGPEAAAAENCSLTSRSMFPMAVATSIDALAVGVTFAFLDAPLFPAVLTIGAMTFVLSAMGAGIGRFFGVKYEFAAEIFGGVILCLLSLKVLLEHFGLF